MTVGELATHLVDSFTPVAACLQRLHPEALGHWEKSTLLPVVRAQIAAGFRP